MKKSTKAKKVLEKQTDNRVFNRKRKDKLPGSLSAPLLIADQNKNLEDCFNEQHLYPVGEGQHGHFFGEQSYKRRLVERFEKLSIDDVEFEDENESFCLDEDEATNTRRRQNQRQRPYDDGHKAGNTLKFSFGNGVSGFSVFIPTQQDTSAGGNIFVQKATVNLSGDQIRKLLQESRGLFSDGSSLGALVLKEDFQRSNVLSRFIAKYAKQTLGLNDELSRKALSYLYKLFNMDVDLEDATEKGEDIDSKTSGSIEIETID